MGAFDDLIPAKKSASSGAFDDLIPQAKPKAKQSTGEYVGRKFQQGALNATSGLSMLAGGLAGLFGATDTSDSLFEASQGMRKAATDQELGVGTDDSAQGFPTRVGGAVIGAIPTLASMVVNPALGVVQASLPSISDAGDNMDAGLSMGATAANLGIDTAGNIAGMYLPAGIGKSAKSIIASAVPIGAGQGIVTDFAKNQITSSENQELAKKYDPLNAEARIVDALMGVAGGVGTARGMPRTASVPQAIADVSNVPQNADAIVADATIQPELSISDLISQFTGAPKSFDNPQDSIRAEIDSNNKRKEQLKDVYSGELAQQVKLYGDELPPQYKEAPITQEQAVADAYRQQGLDPNAVENTFSRARMSDKMVMPESVSEAKGKENTKALAKQAFDLADLRQKRADADLANYNQIDADYQGGLSASNGGVNDSGTRSIFMLGDKQFEPMYDFNGNPRIDEKGNVFGTTTDVDGNEVRGFVSTKKLKQVTSPVNQRLATDFMERSTQPQKGVGTGTRAQEKMPMRSTDIISGDKVGGFATRNLSDPYTPEPREPSGDVSVEQAPPAQRTLKQPRKGDTVDGEVVASPQKQKLLENAQKLRDVAETSTGKDKNELLAKAEKIEKQAAKIKEESLPQPVVKDDLTTDPVSGVREIARIGGKNSSEIISVRDNGDQLEVLYNKEPLINFDTEADVTVPRNATLDDIKQAIKESGQFGRKTIISYGKDYTPFADAPVKKTEPTATVAKETAANVTPEQKAKTERKPAPKKKANTLLATIKRNGGLAMRDKLDVTGEDKSFAVGGYNQIFNNNSRTSLKGMIEGGALDDYLPPDMRLSSNGMGGEAFDSTPAYEYLAEKIANGDRVIPFDAQQELDALNYDSRIYQEVVDNLSKGDVNEQFRIASNEESQNPREANDFDTSNTQSGIDGGRGVEGGTEPRADGNRGNGQPEPELLTNYDEAELQRRTDEINKKEAELKAKEKEINDKIEADKQVNDFTLSGSDRPADVAASKGQKDIFDTNVEQVKKDFGDGGTTFYSGIPLDAMYEAVTDALKKLYNSDFVNNNMAEWKARTQAFNQAEAADKAASGSKDGGFVRGMKLAYRGFDSLITGQTAVLSSIAARHNNSPTINKIVTMFNDRTGTGDAAESGVTYYQEVEQHFTTTMNDVAEAIGDKNIGNTAYWNGVVKRIKAGVFDNTEAGKSAKKIADTLNKELTRLRASGVDIGESKNYFPDRELNEQQVIGNQAAFTQAATKAYMKNGMSLPDAKQSAEAWLQNILMGDSDASGSPFMPQQSGSPDTSFIKKRALSNDASQILRDAGFYYDNPLDSLTTYFYRTSRKTAYENRFGGKTSDGKGHAKWREIEDSLLAEGNGEAIKEVRNMMRSLLGEMPSPNAGEISRKAVSFLQSANVITYLSGIGTLLTSLPEQVIGAARTGNLADVPRSIYFTARNVAASSAKKFGLDQNWAKSLSSEQAYEAAEMIGAVSHRLLNDTMLHNRLGGEMTNKKANLAVQTALRWNGLQGLTRAQRAAMIELGAKWMNTLAKENVSGAGGKLNELSLAELGVPKDKQAAFSKWLDAQAKAEYGGIEVGKLNSDAEMNTLYRNALYKFNSQTIMNPNRGQQPRMASHPVGKVAYGLLSYTYAYTDAVLKRSGRLMKEAATGKGYTASERMKLLTPAIVAAGVVPLLQYALMPMRDTLNGTTDEQKQKRLDREFMGVGGDKIEAIQRSGVLGKYDPLVNMVTGLKYNRDMSNALLGASAGGLAQTVTAGINLAQTEKNSPNTNTAERAFANSAWSTLIEPTIVYNSTRYLPSAIGVPVQLGIKNKQTREAAVDKIAGKKKEKGGLQGLDGLKGLDDAKLKSL